MHAWPWLAGLLACLAKRVVMRPSAWKPASVMNCHTKPSLPSVTLNCSSSSALRPAASWWVANTTHHDHSESVSRQPISQSGRQAVTHARTQLKEGERL
jgi:hypothetical protein